MSRMVLVSLYELGAQPLGIAILTGPLRRAGHEVTTCDLAIEEWPTAAIAAADWVVCSVPMHTATRLASDVAERARRERPGVRLAFYGLYGGVASAAGLCAPGDVAVASEQAAALFRALADADGTFSLRPEELEGPPDRSGLPGLDRYARFVEGDAEHLVGTVATTTGCNHRCRHCPVPVLYAGRSRPVGLDDLLADLDALVGAGATHVHFADPDFLNRPPHTRRVVEAMHAAHPELTFDATIKVSHLLREQELVTWLAERGLRMVTSAIESTSAVVLERLQKGHDADDAARAVLACHELGIELRPSLLPFTPWTTREELVELLDFAHRYDLVGSIDAVQWSIRLLLPPGSLLLEEPDETLRRALLPAEPGELARSWRAADPLLDELASEVAAIAEGAERLGQAPEESYLEIRQTLLGAFGRSDPLPRKVGPAMAPSGARAHLTESWFCCAEPTGAQLGALRDTPEEATVFLGAAIGIRR